MTILLILTALIFLSYYLLFIRLKIDSTHQKIILAGLGGFGQIILTQLFLGVIGLLYLPALIFLNGGVTAIILLCSGIFEKNIRKIVQLECYKIAGGLRNVFSLENVLLLILLGFVFIWTAIVIFNFSPGVYDALTYHLPPIYEYIINHKIFLLPVEFNMRFAFPENAELLFMWPAIFLHSQQFVNSIQLIVALWGSVVIYGLARILGIYSKISLFISLLFLFTPIVLGQWSICYIDIITSVFLLIILYCAGMFYQSNRLIYFYSTAFAVGILCGMKYNELIFIFMVVPFLCVKRTAKPRQWLCFILILLMTGGYWYLRNFLILKTPIYPLPFSQDSFNVYTSQERHATVTFLRFLILIPSKLLFLWKDFAYGFMNAGYGLIFWGLGLPAWFYGWIRSIIQKNKFDFWLYSFLVIGIGQLMLAPLEDFRFPGVARYSIFVPAVGLLALGQVMMLFDKFVFFRKSIRVLCIIFSVLAVVHSSNDSGSRIDRPIKDFINEIDLTQESFNHEISSWAVLDYLTVNDPKGLSCYMETKSNIVSSAYGTELQNRIWDLQKDRPSMPDVFLYLNARRGRPCLNPFGPQIPLKEMMVNHDYSLIVVSPDSFLFIRKDFFRNPLKQQLLVKYFKNIEKQALLSAH